MVVRLKKPYFIHRGADICTVRLVCKHMFQGLAQEKKGLLTLLMAALNNQACISYEMGSYDEYYSPDTYTTTTSPDT
jgi:hypothetical protein